MKKRVKLLTTIASLCLAVALMAFGVYAATSSQLKVGSTVSFTTTNVAVKYTVEVTHSANVTVDETTAEKDEYTTKYSQTISYGVEADDANADWNVGTYTFGNDATADDYVTYTITIENLGENAFQVKATGIPAKGAAANNFTIDVTNDDNLGAEAVSISGKDSAVVVVTYKITDLTKDATDATLALQFDVAKTF